MTTTTKVALALRSDLATWQKLNVTAFLTSGFGTTHPAVIGREYTDAEGQRYSPMLAMPVRVFGGDGVSLGRGLERALDRGLIVSVFTDEMFATMTDADNRAAVAAVPTAELSIAGFGVVGDAKQVDKAFDKLKPHQ